MISIAFSTTNKIVSRIVRWFTKSTVSHSFIMFDWMGGKWVLESEWNGIQIIPFEKFMAKGNILVAKIDMPNLTDADLQKALASTGVRYDYGGLFGSAFPIVGQWFKKKWHNPWNDPKALFCSEFIVSWLQEIGTIGATELVPAETDPESLLNVISVGSVCAGSRSSNI